MRKLKIKPNDIREYLEIEPIDLPKYAASLLNLANRFSGGTRPRVVGQMTELIQEFSGRTIDEWEKWYIEHYPDSIEEATRRVRNMIDNFRRVLDELDDENIRTWVNDLVIVQTFIGLKFQEAIIAKLAENLDIEYRLANPEEEAKGIDGFIGETPVSIKPATYEQMNNIKDNINAEIIFYEKKKDYILIEYNHQIK